MRDTMSHEVGGVLFEVGDRYEVLGLLGQGSFGIVAAGLERGTGKKLAIKRVQPIAVSCSGARHVLRELAIMRALRYHPNIINLEDIRVDATSSTLYIVMELMECDLERILASGQDLSTEHVQVLLKQLLLGVQAMHHHGFLHRDLKPANILCLGDCQLRITDFGLSRRIRMPSSEDDQRPRDENMAEVSLTGYVVTRWYRAPEVMLAAEGSYGEPVDIWSIGCVLGEMLGSRGALFPGKNYVDQVSVTLAAVGKPGIEDEGALGYELDEDALEFLRKMEPPQGRLLESLVPSDVDKDALHLLKLLLDINTSHRLTASQALEHPFLRGCPTLPTAGASAPHGADAFTVHVGEHTPDFSFEDDDLTVDELGKLIKAQAAEYEDARQDSRQGRGGEEGDAPPHLAPLQPTLSLKDVLGSLRTQARRQDRDSEETVARAGTGHDVGGAATGIAVVSQLAPTLEKRFSSMANLAEATDGGVHGLDSGHPAGSVRKVASEPALRSPVAAATPHRAERDEDDDNVTPHAANENHSTPPGEDDSARNGVAKAENIAATRIQATCRRRAAEKAVHNRRKKHRSSGEDEVRPPVCGGGCAATATQQLRPDNLEERKWDAEKDRAAAVVQKSHRHAAEIRRARSEREQCLQDQQFLFGPGFQQPAARTTRDTSRATECSRDSERQGRPRDASFLASTEDEERQQKSSRAAIKIQTQARRKAASRRVAAARQRRAAAAAATAAKTERTTVVGAAATSMPKLPIDSSAPVAMHRAAAPMAQREPLAILRQLKSDPEVQPKPRTDQFRLRMTIKSAIEAHIEKTGAARRKPRPLPTVPSSRQNLARAKIQQQQQQQQQQQHVATARAPLSKTRVVSPLHRTVRQVNTFFAATDKHEREGRALDKRRAQSAPLSKATDRLRCAIFAAETMVEREYARAERRQSFGGNNAIMLPMDDLSRDLLASPLLVPYRPPAPVGSARGAEAA